MNVDQNTRKRLKNRVERIRPLLKHETFVPVDVTFPEDINRRATVQMLNQIGAIKQVETVGRIDKFDKQRQRTKWAWKKDYRETILEWLQDRNELPCGHRSHIHNPKEVDGLSCKYCREKGREPIYSKSVVKEAL
jgi:hypothetical protein